MVTYRYNILIQLFIINSLKKHFKINDSLCVVKENHYLFKLIIYIIIITIFNVALKFVKSIII